MSIDKQNSTQQQQQPLPLSLFAMLAATSRDLGLPVRSIPNSGRNRKEQQAFLRSILEQAIEIANEVDDYFSDEACSESYDGEEEDSCIQNRNRNQ
jgi:hypothetical protein